MPIAVATRCLEKRNASAFDRSGCFGLPRHMRHVHGFMLSGIFLGVVGCSSDGAPTPSDIGDSDDFADVVNPPPDVPSVPPDASLDVAGADDAVAAETSDDTAADVPVSVPTACPELPCDPGELCAAGVCVCDPAPVSYANDIAPFLETGCGPGCHVYVNPSTGSAGLNLAAAHSFKDLVNAPAFQCGERRRVVPGDIDASYLMDKMLGRDLCAGNLMPRGRSPWTTEKLAPLGRWICQGAADN